jgi:hypothetical protein
MHRRVVILVLATSLLAILLLAALLPVGPVAATQEPPNNISAPRPAHLPEQGSPAPAPGCGAWSIVPSANPGSADHALWDVEAKAADDAWAVGYYRHDDGWPRTLTEHWNGTQWTTIDSPAPNRGSELNSVSALASNDVWAVGYRVAGTAQTLVTHWDGASWSEVPSPNVGACANWLTSVRALSPNNVWAVGYYYLCDGTSQTLTMQWDGSAWNVVPSPNMGSNDNELYGITANAWTDIWAVGYYVNTDGVEQTLILHWNGLSWSVVPSPSVGAIGNNRLYAVSSVSSSDVWAVGHYLLGTAAQTLTLHWDGTDWTHVPAPNPGSSGNYLRGLEAEVNAVGQTEAWAVGYHSSGGLAETLALHWDGSDWSVMPTSNVAGEHNYLFGVDAFVAGPRWASGYYGAGAGARTLVEQYTAGNCPTATPVPSTTIVASATATRAVTNTGTTVPVTATAATTSVPPTATRPPTQTTPTSTACPLEFTDVPPGSTFYEFVRCLACRGILGGYGDGTFRPGNDITRGQISKVVSNAAGLVGTPTTQTYEDVSPNHTFYEGIERLSALGVMGGYPCGQLVGEPCTPPENRPYFRPQNNATRGQVSKIVAEAADLGGTPTGQTYTDVPPDHPFYLWIERLSALGAMGGYACGGPGEPCDPQNRAYFRPGNNVTRGQASKIVANTFFPDCSTPSRSADATSP